MDDEASPGEWPFAATDAVRIVVSEAYPWSTTWYVWRERRLPNGAWDFDTADQRGPAFTSLEAACGYARRLVEEERAKGQPRVGEEQPPPCAGREDKDQ